MNAMKCIYLAVRNRNFLGFSADAGRHFTTHAHCNDEAMYTNSRGH